MNEYEKRVERRAQSRTEDELRMSQRMEIAWVEHRETVLSKHLDELSVLRHKLTFKKAWEAAYEDAHVLMRRRELRGS
jgi:hypothetical protein